jgi:hypothetical protein
MSKERLEQPPGESLSFNVYRMWRYENVVLHNRAMIAWSMSFAIGSVCARPVKADVCSESVQR